MAVGSPAPTSFAKVGPDNTAPARAPSTSLATWCGSMPVAISNPLVAQAMRVSLPKCGLMFCRVARKPCEGTAIKHVARAVEGLPQVLGSLQFVGESGTRQVALIAPRFPHHVDLRTVPSPQPGGMAFARELYGERRAPGTGADNRHRFCAPVLHSPRRIRS